MSVARYKHSFGVCLATLFIGGPVGAAAGGDPVEEGHAIVQQKCSRCHAITMTDKSTHPQAPPFRSVVTRYPVEDLAEALAEGIVSGHPDMPEFVFEPEQINAILAYLNTLKAPGTGK